MSGTTAYGNPGCYTRLRRAECFIRMPGRPTPARRAGRRPGPLAAPRRPVRGARGGARGGPAGLPNSSLIWFKMEIFSGPGFGIFFRVVEFWNPVISKLYRSQGGDRGGPAAPTGGGSGTPK